MSTNIRRAILAAIGIFVPTIGSAQPPAGVVEYHHTDAVGSVRAVTDQSGTVVRRHDYFAFGELAEDCATQPDTKLFTGQQRDRESCLDYFNARYYANRPGRFTTVDPAHVGGNIFDPQSWNAYAYARNNPLRFIDPAGTEYVTWGTGTGMATASDLQFSGVFSAYDPNVLVRGSRESGELWVRMDNDWVFAGYYQQTKVDPTFNSMVRSAGDRAAAELKVYAKEVAVGAVSGVASGAARWGVEAGVAAIGARAATMTAANAASKQIAGVLRMFRPVLQRANHFTT